MLRQFIESSTWHTQCHLIPTLNLEDRVFLFPFYLWLNWATERIRNLPQMTQLKYFNPKSPVSKTRAPVCDAAPGLWSGLGMRQSIRPSHHPTTWRELRSSEGGWSSLVLLPRSFHHGLTACAVPNAAFPQRVLFDGPVGLWWCGEMAYAVQRGCSIDTVNWT